LSDIKDIEKLKKRVDSYKAKIERSKGAKEEALRKLKEEFDVDNIADAKDLLEQIRKRERVAKKKFDKAMEKFKEAWSERIKS